MSRVFSLPSFLQNVASHEQASVPTAKRRLSQTPAVRNSRFQRSAFALVMSGLLGCMAMPMMAQAQLIQEQKTRVGVSPASTSADFQARQLMRGDDEAMDEGDVTTLPSRSGSVTRFENGSAVTRVIGGTNGYDSASEALPVVNLTQRDLTANAAIVMDAVNGNVLFDKKADTTVPIASITKLMTAMVTADARLDMNEQIVLEASDFEGPKRASSTLRVGDTLNRAEVLLLALMKSENPAAKALSRTYPGGFSAFVKAMNSKARALGMKSAFFGDPTGLDSRNSATPLDLAKMVRAAYEYGVIRQFSTTQAYDFNLGNRVLHAKNTNALVREGFWDIGLSKTGYINEAGRCVVMQAKVNQHPAYIVLMGANTSQSRSGDATRILSWLQNKFSH